MLVGRIQMIDRLTRKKFMLVNQWGGIWKDDDITCKHHVSDVCWLQCLMKDTHCSHLTLKWPWWAKIIILHADGKCDHRWALCMASFHCTWDRNFEWKVAWFGGGCWWPSTVWTLIWALWLGAPPNTVAGEWLQTENKVSILVLQFLRMQMNIILAL